MHLGIPLKDNPMSYVGPGARLLFSYGGRSLHRIAYLGPCELLSVNTSSRVLIDLDKCVDLCL